MNLISKEKVAIRLMNSTDNDMNFILRWLTNPEVIAWVYDEDAPWDIDKVKIKFARKADGLGSAIPCFIMYDDKAIGYLQYYPLEEDSYIFNSPETFREIEGGYGLDMFIGEPELWDKGIGSQVIDFGKGSLEAEAAHLLYPFGHPVSGEGCGVSDCFAVFGDFSGKEGMFFHHIEAVDIGGMYINGEGYGLSCPTGKIVFVQTGIAVCRSCRAVADELAAYEETVQVGGGQRELCSFGGSQCVLECQSDVAGIQKPFCPDRAHK